MKDIEEVREALAVSDERSNDYITILPWNHDVDRAAASMYS